MIETPSPDDAAGSKSTLRTKKDWWPRTGALAAVLSAFATIVLAIAAVMALDYSSSKNSEEVGPGVSASPSAELTEDSVAETRAGEQVSTYPDETRTIETEESPLTPGCAVGGAPTSCEAEHDSEVAVIQPCTAEGLIRFMGGSTQLEVMRDVLTTEPQGNICLISGIDSSTKQSLAQILSLPAGDTYRRCWTLETDTEVGCHVPHFAEQIYAGGSESVDCEQRFGHYVGKDFRAFAKHLEIEARPGATSACWVKMRVSNQLTASIRNLKDRPLPLRDA